MDHTSIRMSEASLFGPRIVSQSQHSYSGGCNERRRPAPPPSELSFTP
jgi:hypothetical protein